VVYLQDVIDEPFRLGDAGAVRGDVIGSGRLSAPLAEGIDHCAAVRVIVAVPHRVAHDHETPMNGVCLTLTEGTCEEKRFSMAKIQLADVLIHR